ncbi:MAG: beta-ketoacyl-[acyl-carrier-protein] synthase family protein [Flavipsychrobacter sp.]|nr:beta-ketoacyl-[acyl-carrier-protein] synthase family protein [Flavipsychrobacter sp.]
MINGQYTDSPIYVAGAGIICAIGNNVGECITSFEHGAAGMGAMTYLNSVHKELPVAEVKYNNEELAAMANMPVNASRTALLSCIAAREALADAGIENIRGLRSGFISANTVGGMDKSEQFFETFTANRDAGRLRNVNNHECGSITEMVAEQLNLRDQVTTISTACSSSANAIFYAARLIRHGLLDVAVAGGTDALTKFTLNGFNTLMILDKEYCRPFDDTRAGLNLGEGAGYVVLVSEKVAASLQHIYCRFSGYNNSNDAYHQTASSPDGTGSYLAMQGALKKAKLQPADIDYINLHGTGTQNNDNAEGTAITRLFAPHVPRVSSTKSFTGHTLGASGGIEAVFSALSVKHGYVYPNLRFETPMKELQLMPETSFVKNVPLQHVLSNSFGFGGNCTSLIFSKA